MDNSDDPVERAFEGGLSIDISSVVAIGVALETDPDNVLLRATLAGATLGIQMLGKDQHQDLVLSNLLWWIGHHPDSAIISWPRRITPMRGAPDANALLSKAWRRALAADPDNIRVLQNAADFLGYEHSEQAKELLLKACQLAPDDPAPRERLGDLLTTGRRHIMTPREWREALEHYESALSKREDDSPIQLLLEKVCKAALEVGELDRARAVATQLLIRAKQDPEDWNTGNAVHDANQVLGRVALREGDVESAKRHLLAAGRTSGSPQLDSF
ncbi:MAG: tetratricopeptide repeat protein, partial [Planctomycetota bacterium]